MNQSKKEIKLRQIISGFFLFRHKGQVLKYLEPNNVIMSDLTFYTENLDEILKAEGFISDDEALKFLVDNSLWTQGQEEELDTCRKDISKLQSEKPKYKYQERMLKTMNVAIEKLQQRIAELSETRYSLFSQTISFQQTYRTNIYLLYFCVKNMDGSSFWSSMEQLENETPNSEIEEILKHTCFSNKLDEATVRDLARSEPWRCMWKTASKTGSSLFAGPTTNVTKSQYELCYWSNVYDSVYDSADFPGQSVIEDDEALDLWFIEQSNKHSSSSKSDTSYATNPKILGAKEVFIQVDSQEDAQKVYSELNSSSSRRIIRERTDKIETSVMVSEDQLPDVQNGLRIEMNKLSMVKK